MLSRQLRARALGAVVLLCMASQSAAELTVGKFDAAASRLPVPWQLIHLEPSAPPTKYRQILWDGAEAIEARAESSMALLGRIVDIDLLQTPVLCWRWRIDSVVQSADMTRRRGDDYAARIYLAFALPRESLSLVDRAALTLARGIFGPQIPDGAINFVWDNRHPPGTHMPNAYTSRAQMVVLRSGNTEAGFWVGERVHVSQEMERAFSTSKGKLQLLALGSDSDNSGETVRAGFADIHFVRADQPCAHEWLRAARASPVRDSPNGQ